jgi:hypothetical protein
MQATTRPANFKGHYLINPKYAPTGANRVDFEVRGKFMSINYEAFREAEEKDLQYLWEKKVRG